MSPAAQDRVLVTGASGFVGSHVLELLRTRGHEVHAVSSRGPGGERDGVEWHAADLLEPGAADALIAAARPARLLHLAWFTRPGAVYHSVENVRWAEASLALLRAFARGGGARAVLGGTCAEYDWSAGLCSESGTPTTPATLYGASKLAVGELATAAAGALGVEVACARIFFLYGPGEHPDRLVPAVARAALRGEPAETTSGTQLRDYLHVADAAGALAALLDASAVGPVNVGSGVPTRVGEIAERVARAAGRPDLLRAGARPTPAGEAPVVYADVRRLREEVGWVPRVSLEDGVADAVAHWRGRA